jgi:hypothetical protein
VSTVSASVSAGNAAAARLGPPGWLIAATAVLAFGSLALAVAETNLWMHYLIDAGESLSLVGVAFIVLAGLHLYRQRRLSPSIAFAVPWLIFPIITQGDQIIDNLSINWMRFVCHVLLGLLFGTPVAVVVLAVRYATGARGDAHAQRGRGFRWADVIPGFRLLADGRTREGCAILAVMLLVAEIWVAVRFLGLLMVATLIVMVWAVLVYGFADRGDVAPRTGRRPERFALALLLAGAAVSLGLFSGFKNRVGAYQGSPSYYLDPSQGDVWFRLDSVKVTPRPAVPPRDAAGLKAALNGYAGAFQRLLDGYYVLDRNYNYHFHNELFLRSSPLLPEYRQVGLGKIREAEVLRAEADRAAAVVRSPLEAADPTAALLDDLTAYAAFTFRRASLLETMSAEFERTPAGLQHATHLYEGEGKVLGVRLADILAKHNRVLTSAPLAPITADFIATSRAVYDAYANRVVGF